jgi:hypothetical protein
MNFETLWRKLRLECNGELIELAAARLVGLRRSPRFR